MTSPPEKPLLGEIRGLVASLGRSAGRLIDRVRGRGGSGETARPTSQTPSAKAPPPAEVPPEAVEMPRRAPPADVAGGDRFSPTHDLVGDAITTFRAFRHVFDGFEGWGLPVRPWPAATVMPAIPPGASFERHVFSSSAGSRDYRLYVPASIGARANGLVVMLHGCRQTPEDFAVGTRMNEAAERAGMLVVYPRQPVSANPNGCWNWYRLPDQMRHGGEAAILAGLVRELTQSLGLSSGRVFVAGLSAGGAMTAILTHAFPELFAAACIHSGVATGLADDLRSGLAAMKGRFRTPTPPRIADRDTVPTLVVQGEADAVVHPSNADRLFAGFDPGPGGSVRAETREIGTRRCTVTTCLDGAGRIVAREWRVGGGGHAWFGGDPAGSYADPEGPDSTAEMLRFFTDPGLRRRGG